MWSGNHPMYTVSRDGGRFLFGRLPPHAHGGRRVLVRNLFTELGPVLRRQ